MYGQCRCENARIGTALFITERLVYDFCMKILLFGSGFNPPHSGHLALLQLAVSHRKPDLVLLVPTGNPPHKKIVLSSPKARLAMTKELAKLLPVRCEVLDFELKNKRVSYTYNTLRHIKKLYPGCHIDLLMGSDMLFYLNKWHRYKDIIHFCTVVAAVRKDEDRRSVTSAAVAIKHMGGDVDILSLKPVITSSSEVRRLIQSFLPYEHVVPSEISQIIKSERLYRPIHLRTLSLEVKNLMSQKRYHHTLMVCKMAIILARRNNYSIYKAAAAALLHDVAKEFSREKMLQLIANSGIITRWQDTPFPIWHGFAGAEYAKKELGVLDETILDAIRFHSVGRGGMSMLDKIIFLADMVSEDREFDELVDLRGKALCDLDGAVHDSLMLNLSWLRRDGKDITVHTIEAIEAIERLAHPERQSVGATATEKQ